MAQRWLRSVGGLSMLSAFPSPLQAYTSTLETTSYHVQGEEHLAVTHLVPIAAARDEPAATYGRH